MRSWKPTHPTPLTELEASKPRNQGGKGWQAGGRFVWVSHFGSKKNNSGSRGLKTPRGSSMTPSERPEKPVKVPGWARRYRDG